jgi:heme A synthase
MRTAHRLALLTTAATFVLLLIGGVVPSTGSSLACPDWPTCHGTLMPEMVGGVLFEHTHRLVASAVGLLTLVLAAALWRRRGATSLRGLGIAAALLVVFQGVLGGLTVLWKLPPLVSSAHLGVSMLYFALILLIAFRSREDHEPVLVSPRARGWVGAAGIAIYAQIVLGAWVRHQGAGLACTDLPLCAGALWPGDASARLHMLHRIGAVVSGALLCAAAVAMRRHAPHGWLRALTWLLPLGVVGQIALGALSVVRGLELFLITGHLGLGALLWAGAVSLWLGTRPLVVEATAGDPVMAEAAR